jgi:hypothetical protein
MEDSLNEPEAFMAMSPEKREALRGWIRRTLRPTTMISHSAWGHSYSLKHEAESSLGWYVSNGQVKGGMVEAGYRYVVVGKNWRFNSTSRQVMQRVVA